MDMLHLSEEQQNRLLDEIEKHGDLTEADRKVLKVLSKSEFSDIKIGIAQMLVNDETPESTAILLSMIEDEDDLVRINAIDSLCGCQDTNVMKRLMDIAQKDMNHLVREYAILSAVDIAKSREECGNTGIVPFLQQVLKREIDSGIRLACYRGLYLFGDKRYLSQLEQGLLEEDYRNRCAAVHILSEIADDKNVEQIRTILMNARKKEKIHAVADAIDRALSEMQ